MTEPTNGRSTERRPDDVLIEFNPEDYESIRHIIDGGAPASDVKLSPTIFGLKDEAEAAALREAIGTSNLERTAEILGDRRMYAVPKGNHDDRVELLPPGPVTDERQVSMRVPTNVPSQYARAEAMKQFSHAILPQDKKGRLQISGTVMLDSAQLRYINGTSQRMGLAYVLDTRLNSMLDSGGLHLLSLDSVYRTQDGEAIVKAYTWIKLAYVIEPISVYLAVRMRDWMQLKPAKESTIENAPTSVQTIVAKDAYAPPVDGAQFSLTMGDIAPDDRTVWGNP